MKVWRIVIHYPSPRFQHKLHIISIPTSQLIRFLLPMQYKKQVSCTRQTSSAINISSGLCHDHSPRTQTLKETKPIWYNMRRTQFNYTQQLWKMALRAQNGLLSLAIGTSILLFLPYAPAPSLFFLFLVQISSAKNDQRPKTCCVVLQSLRRGSRRVGASPAPLRRRRAGRLGGVAAHKGPHRHRQGGGHA